MRSVRPRPAAGGRTRSDGTHARIPASQPPIQTHGVPVMAMRPSNKSTEPGDDGAAAAEGNDGNESDMVIASRTVCARNLRPRLCAAARRGNLPIYRPEKGAHAGSRASF